MGWVLSIVVVGLISIYFDLLLRGSIYDTLTTMPVFLMLLSTAVFIHSKGLKYTGISVFLGLAIGIVKMNHIFFIEDLSGQGTMNGAYALFACLHKGILSGFIADAVFAASKRLAHTGIFRRENITKELQEKFKIW